MAKMIKNLLFLGLISITQASNNTKDNNKKSGYLSKIPQRKKQGNSQKARIMSVKDLKNRDEQEEKQKIQLISGKFQQECHELQTLEERLKQNEVKDNNSQNEKEKILANFVKTIDNNQKHIDNLDKHTNQHQKHLDGLGKSIDNLDKHTNQHQKHLDNLGKSIDNFDKHTNQHQKGLDTNKKCLQDLFFIKKKEYKETEAFLREVDKQCAMQNESSELPNNNPPEPNNLENEDPIQETLNINRQDYNNPTNPNTSIHNRQTNQSNTIITLSIIAVGSITTILYLFTTKKTKQAKPPSTYKPTCMQKK